MAIVDGNVNIYPPHLGKKLVAREGRGGKCLWEKKTPKLSKYLLGCLILKFVTSYELSLAQTYLSYKKETRMWLGPLSWRSE